MFINLSNHASDRWDACQLREASEYGDIIDIPFPQIDPRDTDDRINSFVDEYYRRIVQYTDPVVMLQGEYVFTYRLVRKLKESSIKVFAGCSERCVNETVDEEGRTVKSVIFKFIRFREY